VPKKINLFISVEIIVNNSGKNTKRKKKKKVIRNAFQRI